HRESSSSGAGALTRRHPALIVTRPTEDPLRIERLSCGAAILSKSSGCRRVGVYGAGGLGGAACGKCTGVAAAGTESIRGPRRRPGPGGRARLAALLAIGIETELTPDRTFRITLSMPPKTYASPAP